MPDRSRRMRLFVAALAAAPVLAVLAAPASAHVTVHSFEARAGGTDVGVTLRVPNERDNASTVKVQVSLPQDTPLIGVLLRPMAGWTSTVTTAKVPKPVKTDDGTITEAASLLTWTGGKIGPGQYQDFDFDVGLLPNAKQVQLKVLQTYSDGAVVRWIDPTTIGQPAPEHPAATLSLTGSTGGGGSTGTAGASASGPAAGSPPDAASKSSVNLATGLAVAGLVVGAAAGLLAGLALARRSAPDDGT